MFTQIVEIIKDTWENVKNFEIFDVKSPEDLYKLFLFCHIFSWMVVFYKLKN